MEDRRGGVPIRSLAKPPFQLPTTILTLRQPDELQREKEGSHRKIEAIISNKESYRIMLAQKGERAQQILDNLQNLYDCPDTTPKLRSQIFTAIVRLSKLSGLYPTCLVLDNVVKLGEHPVASGGFGEIWKGLIGDELACLKVVRIYGESDVQKLLKGFLKEAILWKQLKHPNVLPFLGLYFLDDTKQRICLISPWMEHGNLRQYLQDHCDKPIDRVLLAYDVACGLSYLHDEKIIHGDLKGDNILITPSGRASIADFGLSRITNSEALHWSSVSTTTHEKGGSARWLAPECLINGQQLTRSSDVYAFGGVCYETFTGRIPFHEFKHDAAVAIQLMKGNRPSRPFDNLHLRDDIWTVIQDCWEQDPSIRPHANTLRSQFISIASHTLELANDWNNCLPTELWKNIQRPKRSFPNDLEKEIGPTSLRRYSSHLVFEPGERINMNLSDESGQLIHEGKLFQPEGGFIRKGLNELYVLLFDDYLVLTKPKVKDGVTKYHANHRPVLLDFILQTNFTDPPIQRHGGNGLFRRLSNSPTLVSPGTDSGLIYPLTLYHSGHENGFILYAESAQSRLEWKQKLEEALAIRKAVQESNQLFEMERLSPDTSSTLRAVSSPVLEQKDWLARRLTCLVSFDIVNGQGLLALGCADGVWIGFRHDPTSIQHVLQLKMVSQCAVLESSGIFLVLADKSLFAYHVEALVRSESSVQVSKVPHKLNGKHDVHSFNIGSLQGRMLVVYMAKKGQDNIFRVLEVKADRIDERAEVLAESPPSNLFRVYKDFAVKCPGAFDFTFLEAWIVVLCEGGFEIIDLEELESETVPQRTDPRLRLLAKRFAKRYPKAIFCSADDEFLLCYNEFGLFVNRYGQPGRVAELIQWEGTAERVALQFPYVLLFNPRFIEVRHLQTGRLVQVIPGSNVRCIWDSRRLDMDNIPVHNEVHVVMGAPSISDPSTVLQQVFALCQSTRHLTIED
ncbi:Rho guanine nucleotide exchange factor [Stygiomarasmius scandens]|uniref:Rho guanine nucleotide exchange factor n=1 Tax=Marasmiellus scandens TaxID=2682957 RepID=A0ABR1ISS3_9AGAR